MPARAVTNVGDGEVRLALSRAEMRQLPDVAQPHIALDAETTQGLVATSENAAARWPQQT